MNNNETVCINMGESANRALRFMQETAFTTENISSVDDCERFDRSKYNEMVWKPFENY